MGKKTELSKVSPELAETGTEKAGAVDKTIEKSSMRKGKNEKKGNQVQLALF